MEIQIRSEEMHYTAGSLRIITTTTTTTTTTTIKQKYNNNDNNNKEYGRASHSNYKALLLPSQTEK
jgi:(p)ppGpp synthase/HD superfamily hydrolase